MLKTFAKMVNDCGGINGRKLDLVAVVEQAGGAADQATTLAKRAWAACIKATEDEKPLIVMTWTGSFAAPQCITDDQQDPDARRPRAPRTST